MKTFKTVIVTMMITLGVGLVLVGKFLLGEGIVTIQKESTNHEKVVMVDGQVTEQTKWDELLGYTVSIDVVDSAYFGK